MVEIAIETRRVSRPGCGCGCWLTLWGESARGTQRRHRHCRARRWEDGVDGDHSSCTSTRHRASSGPFALVNSDCVPLNRRWIRRAKSGGGVGSPTPSDSPRASATKSSDTPKSAPSHPTTQAPRMPSCELLMLRHRSALLQPAPMLPLSQCGRRKARIRHPTSRCATWRFLHRAHKDGPFSTSQKRRTTLLSIWHQFGRHGSNPVSRVLLASTHVCSGPDRQ
jgi:hypothetical protein